MKLRLIAALAICSAGNAFAFLDTYAYPELANQRYSTTGDIIGARPINRISAEMQMAIANKYNVPANSTGVKNTMLAMGKAVQSNLPKVGTAIGVGVGAAIPLLSNPAVGAIVGLAAAGASLYSNLNTPLESGGPLAVMQSFEVRCAANSHIRNYEFFPVGDGNGGTNYAWCPGIYQGQSVSWSIGADYGCYDSAGTKWGHFGFQSHPSSYCSPEERAAGLGQPLALPQTMTEAQKAANMSTQAIADLINKLMAQAAAQPGYQGLPYDPYNPVTATNVQPARTNYGTSIITKGGDMIIQNPTTTIMPWGDWNIPISGGEPVLAPAAPIYDPSTGNNLNPGTGVVIPPTDTGTGTTPGTGTTVDMTDPNIGAPSVDDAPIWRNILAPLLNGFDAWKNWQLPAQQASCPIWEFDLALVNTHVVIDSHCQLVETVRPTLEAVFKVMWLLAAILIVFGA
jgi:hypothetical protein